MTGVGGGTDVQTVLFAHSHWVKVELFGKHIHCRFNSKGSLHHAKTAECSGRGVIGIHGVTIGMGVGDHVGTARVGGGAGHDRDSERGISTSVAIKFGLCGGQCAIPFGSQAQVDAGGMPFWVDQHAFAAIEEQFDWFAHSQRYQ